MAKSVIGLLDFTVLFTIKQVINFVKEILNLGFGVFKIVLMILKSKFNFLQLLENLLDFRGFDLSVSELIQRLDDLHQFFFLKSQVNLDFLNLFLQIGSLVC